MRRACLLPALVMPPRLTVSPVERSEGTRPQIAHQLARGLKARQITDFSEHRHCRNEIYSTHGLQSRDNLGKRPLRHRLADCLLQKLDTLAVLAHRVQKLFERNPLLAMIELLQHQPVHVGRSPRFLARIISPQTKHKRRDLLAPAACGRCVPCHLPSPTKPLFWAARPGRCWTKLPSRPAAPWSHGLRIGRDSS